MTPKGLMGILICAKEGREEQAQVLGGDLGRWDCDQHMPDACHQNIYKRKLERNNYKERILCLT